MLTFSSALLAAPLLLGQIPAASGIELRDQHGVVDSVAAHRGEPAIVIVVTARRLRTAKPWQQAIQERHESLRTILISDVPGEPPADYARVAEKLQRRVPEGVAVLIDIDRTWARELDLDTTRPNLLLLDSDGKLVASVHGRWNAETGEELFAAIDLLPDSP